MGFLTLLSGEYALSKRKIANLLGHLNLKISLGSICRIHHLAGEILEEPYEKIKKATLEKKAINADETSWYRKGKRQWLWIIEPRVHFSKLIHPEVLIPFKRFSVKALKISLLPQTDIVLTIPMRGLGNTVGVIWIVISKKSLNVTVLMASSAIALKRRRMRSFHHGLAAFFGGL